MKTWRKVFIVLLFITILGPLKTVSGQFFYFENERIGKEVPDFTLDTLKKDGVNLKERIRGKKSIIFFWATWCPHCRIQLGELVKNKEGLAKNSIELVLVDIGESKPAVQKYVETNGIDFDVFLDIKSEMSEQFNLIGVPTFFIVDEKGVVSDVIHSLPEDLESIFQET